MRKYSRKCMIAKLERMGTWEHEPSVPVIFMGRDKLDCSNISPKSFEN